MKLTQDEINELNDIFTSIVGESLDIINKNTTYKPMFFSWCKSFEEEEAEMRETIEGNPADVKLLKQEYEQLTGKKYRRKKA